MNIVPLMLLLLPRTAAASPLPKGDRKAGKEPHDAKCVACHQRLVDGTGPDIYTRIDRKIETPKALMRRIAARNAQINAGWSPEDEEHAAAHLNRQFHKFK